MTKFVEKYNLLHLVQLSTQLMPFKPVQFRLLRSHDMQHEQELNWASVCVCVCLCKQAVHIRLSGFFALFTCRILYRADHFEKALNRVLSLFFVLHFAENSNPTLNLSRQIRSAAGFSLASYFTVNDTYDTHKYTQTCANTYTWNENTILSLYFLFFAPAIQSLSAVCHFLFFSFYKIHKFLRKNFFWKLYRKL